MKIFFITTHPNQGTGYARVANKITNYLADLPGVEVVYYAFQNYKGQEIKDRFIDPRIKFYDALEIDPESPRGFGDKGIVPAIVKEKPDVLFLYNDTRVANSVMSLIPPENMPPQKILYLDLVYPYQDITSFNNLKAYNFDKIWVFLEYWKEHLIRDIGFNSEIVDVLPHGFDFDKFIDIPQEVAKKQLGFNSDDFLFINLNRNSFRKNLSINISGFLELLKRQNMNPKIKMYFTCSMFNYNNEGVDIIKNTINECIRLGLDVESVINKHIFCGTRGPIIPESVINIIYNAGDVGVNTSKGEGFGLTTLEHIYFNRPQVVSSIPASKEILGKYARLVEPRVTRCVDNQESEGGIEYICDPLDFADAFEYCFKNRDDKPNAREYIKEKYNWGNVYKVLDKYFRKE